MAENSTIPETPITKGYCSIFGLTRRNEEWLNGFFNDKFDVKPKLIHYPDGSNLFFFTNQGNTVENQNILALKLGFIRSSKEIMNSDNLEETYRTVRDNKEHLITGNGILLCINKLEPVFTITSTFMAVKKIYYTNWEEGIICSTDLRALLQVVDKISLDEKAVPMHFLLGIVPGPMTYFKNIQRTFPGETITWEEGKLNKKSFHIIENPGDTQRINSLNTRVINDYFENISEIMSSYIKEIDEAGYTSANLLSGGVDSAVVQLLFNRSVAHKKSRKTFCYTWEAESHKFEEGYSEDASQLLNTDHIYFPIKTDDYPSLLVRTIETIAQPDILVENAVGNLALAEHLTANYKDNEYAFLFHGQGADALHGLDFIKYINRLRLFKNISGLYYSRRFLKELLTQVVTRKTRSIPHLIKILFSTESYRRSFLPRYTLEPTNSLLITTTIPYFDTIRRCWDDTTIKETLEYPHNLLTRCLSSQTITEKVHDIDLVTIGYNPTTIADSIYSANRRSLIPFYYDQDIIQSTRDISSKVRFINDDVVKPIQKAILEQNSLETIAHKSKGGSGFRSDFRNWMTNGVLKEMVHSIDRPGFMSQSDFNIVMGLKRPNIDRFMWRLLTFDIFTKHVYKKYSHI